MVDLEQLGDLILKVRSRGGSCVMRLWWLLSLPLLLLMFAYAGFFGVVNFKVDLHSIVMLSVIFVIYLFFMRHNAYFAVCKFRKNFAQVAQELSLYINKNLISIGSVKKSSSSLDAFIDNYSFGMRNTNFSSVAAGIFPTLGILGTFISIAISMPDFTSQSQEVLEHEISMLLSGVGTAFYISIYGIFLSIWWIFFEKSGLSRFDRDVALIRDETTQYFWGKEETEQAYFRKSMDNFERLERVFENITSHEFTQSLNRALEQRMAAFESIIEQELHSASRVGEVLEVSRQKLNLFVTQQEEVASSLAQTTQQIKELTYLLKTIKKPSDRGDDEKKQL